MDEEKWQKLKSAVSSRKSLLKTTKYDAILLDFPEELEDGFGYHSNCYKNFTAVPKNVNPSGESSSSNVQTRSSEPSSEKTSRTGVLPPICIFCRHVKSASGERLGACETVDAEKKIRKKAVNLNDTKLLSFIGSYLYDDGLSFVSQEAKYHHSCRKNYLNMGRASTCNNKSKVVSK